MSLPIHERLFSRFFRLKIGDDVRAILDPDLEHIRHTKLSRVHKVGLIVTMVDITTHLPI